ncbi:MAG TPA: class I SAM-dependent methyltransferase [Candidatus Acidoferrum sp.]|nr:class I SAM-dependent methyltransferase [Candidatus Acidoferrum sp.]
MLQLLAKALRLIDWRYCRMAFGWCPVCAQRRLFVRLANSDIGIRCGRCRASAVSLSLVDVLRRQLPALAGLDVYELSTRGPVHAWLQRQGARVTGSEYRAGVPSGQWQDGVLCQDVQTLSFGDASFDLCTSTDVFEHVADDGAGFRELWRVLRPRGVCVFTVPLQATGTTIERARVAADGTIVHLLEPEYHGDPASVSDRILALRNYGDDIGERLRQAGFALVTLETPLHAWFGINRRVIVARKAV